MAAGEVSQPEHWHKRAERMRSLAELVHTPEAKSKLLKIAGEYEYLAKRAKALAEAALR